MMNSLLQYKKYSWLLVGVWCSFILRGQSPGGVTGSAIWLKADAGVTTGATFTWTDQSGNSRNGTQTTLANQPTVTSASVNYNPALTFNGTTTRLVLSNLTGLPTITATVEAFAVARNVNTAGGWMHIISYGGSGANTFFTLGKQTGTANAVCAFNGSDAISSALEYANSAPALTNGKYTGTQGVVLSSGVQRGTVTFTANKQITAGRIGCDPTDAAFWNGDIAESIIFPGNLSAANVLKVNSYLALKYGITLDQTTATNYVASDWNGTTGTIFWNGTTNSGYKNNIAGIARDDASALSQKQSKSVNTGLQVVMGNGNTIATTNALNTNTFSADKSALIWGDNAGSVAAWTTTGAPSSRQIVARTWKVQETGTVGSVKVQIADNTASGLPAEVSTVYLLVDADGNFASGATEVAMTLNGSNWEANVDFTSGQFFTFATQVAPAPGGVTTSITLWLKADAGTSSTTDGVAVTAWNNQTGTGGNATTTSNTGTGWTAAAVAAPLYQSGSNSVGINFNPSLNFNGNKWLDGNGNFSTANTFVVSKFLSTPSAVGPTLIGFDRSTGTGGVVESSFYSFNNTYGYQAGAANGNYVEADIAYTLWSIPTVFEGRHVSNTSMISTVNAGGTSTYVQLGATRPNPYTGKYRLGNSSDNAAAIESGVIGEVISYNTNLSATDRLKVQSYLALKYGISLGTTAASVNYTASDATVLWTGSATYQNNIAGIVRDDASALNQKQSKSVNTGLQVVMGNGNTIATDNASNSNTFSADKSALIWGDNAGSVAAWTTTGAPTNRQIVARTWKVQETGTVGSVKVQAPDNTASGLPAEVTTIYLLVDADGNFASGATELAMTLNGTNWEANVDFTSGQFFTFATQVPPAPGGITGATLWLKANAGTSTTTNNTSLTTWTNQTGGTNATGGVAPLYMNNTTDNINFNPVVKFDGTSQYLGIASNLSLTSTAGTFLTVLNKQNTGASNVAIIGSQSATNGVTQFFLATATDYRPSLDGWGGAFNGMYEVQSSTNILAGRSYMLTAQRTSGTGGLFGINGTTNTQTSTNAGAWVSANKYLGASFNGSIISQFYQGLLPEVIVYNTALTTAQLQNVQSYLGIKYGNTLSHNYYASDWNGSTGTTFWSTTTNSGYNNNIAGISRDDASDLNQKQSKSVNTGLQVVMGNGNTIASDNASNTNTFSADKSALVWGDDAGSVAAWTTTGAPPSRQIVARKWKTQETGTVGYVKVQVPDNGGANGLPAETNTVYLLVDADGNFASGATEVAMTLNGTNWEAPVDFTNGQFFTFATQENSPVNLNLAMTANKTTVSSGQNITYTLTLTNSGTNTATNVQVKDRLPAGVNFVSATPSSGTYNSTTGIWTLPSVAGAAAPTLTIVVTAQ